MSISGEKTAAPLSPHEDDSVDENLQSRQPFRVAKDDAGSTVGDDHVAVNERVEISNGGLEAWLGVVAGFCVFVISWGVVGTYGSFQEYYQTVLLPHESPSTLSWVGSVQSMLVVLCGVVSGPLVDAGYLRPLMVSGCFLITFGLMMTSLSTEYYQILLAQGFCVGMGGGIAYIPALAVISSSFTTKRPIAIGCASIGSSIGSVAFPIMFRRLQPSIGFPWAVRTIAFIVLLLSILTCMILCRRPGKRGRARRLVEGKAFADLTFMLFSGSIILVMMAYYIPIFFVPAYARTKLGTSDDLASYMLAIVNGASTFGRTLPYLLGTRVKPIHTLFFCYVAGAIAMFSWIAVTSVAGFIVWLCYWGFLSGIVVTAPSSIVAHPILCPDMHYIGTRLGMMWGIGSLGSLVGGPICGALVNLEAAEWLHPQIFGGMVLVGAVLLQLWPTAAVLSYDRKASSGLNS